VELTPGGSASSIVSTGELVGVGTLIPGLAAHEERGREFLLHFYFVPTLPPVQG